MSRGRNKVWFMAHATSGCQGRSGATRGPILPRLGRGQLAGRNGVAGNRHHAVRYTPLAPALQGAFFLDEHSLQRPLRRLPPHRGPVQAGRADHRGVTPRYRQPQRHGRRRHRRRAATALRGGRRRGARLPGVCRVRPCDSHRGRGSWPAQAGRPSSSSRAAAPPAGSASSSCRSGATSGSGSVPAAWRARRRPPSGRTAPSASWPAATSPSSRPSRGSRTSRRSARSRSATWAFPPATWCLRSLRAARRRLSSARPGRAWRPARRSTSSTTTPTTSSARTWSAAARSSRTRASRRST